MSSRSALSSVSSSSAAARRGAAVAAPALPSRAGLFGSSANASKRSLAVRPVAALATAPPRSVVQLYRSSASSVASAARARALADRARREVSPAILSVELETCFNVGLGGAAPLGRERAATLAWLLAETFEPEALSPESSFGSSGG